MIDLKNLTIEKAHNYFKNGEFTVLELANEYLKVINEKNSDINAYLEIYNDIEEQSKIAQEKFANGTDRKSVV